jgi:hypothetical protein
MQTHITNDWPEVVDVLVQLGADGLFEYFVQGPDETAVYSNELMARSQRAALIEVTAWLSNVGYEPAYRWDTGEHGDSVRRFRATGAA